MQRPHNQHTNFLEQKDLHPIQIDLEDLDAYKYAITANTKLGRYDDAMSLCNRILELSGSQNNTHSKYAKEMLELLSEK